MTDARTSNPVDTAMIAELKRLARLNDGVYLGDQLGNAALRMQGLIEEVERLTRENAELRHDIGRHVATCAEQATELERLTRALADEERVCQAWAADRDRVRAALKRFMAHPNVTLCECGERGCATREALEALFGELPQPPYTVTKTDDGLFLERGPDETTERTCEWTPIEEDSPVYTPGCPGSEEWQLDDGCELYPYCQWCGGKIVVKAHADEEPSEKAGDGPGEEDGPWAEGWDKRAGRCTCEHHDRYHFDDGAGVVRCRATTDCNCKWPSQNGDGGHANG